MKIKHVVQLILVVFFVTGYALGCRPIDAKNRATRYQENLSSELPNLNENDLSEKANQNCNPHSIFESVSIGDNRPSFPFFESLYGIDGQRFSVFRGIIVAATFDQMTLLDEMFNNPHHDISTGVQNALRNIDYSEDFVVAVFRGGTSRLGQAIEVEQIGWRNEKKFGIETLTRSGPGSAAVGEPYHIIKIPKRCSWDQEVDFVLSIDGQETMTQTLYIPPPRLMTTLDEVDVQSTPDILEPEIIVVSTPDEVANLQARFSQQTISQLQQVDYSQHYMIAVSPGQSLEAGHALQVDDIVRRGDRMVLHTQTTEVEEMVSENAAPYHLLQVDNRYEVGDTIDFVLAVDDQEILTHTHHIPFLADFETIELSAPDASPQQENSPDPSLLIASKPDEVVDLIPYLNMAGRNALQELNHHDKVVIAAFLGQQSDSNLEVYQVNRQAHQILINAKIHETEVDRREDRTSYHLLTIDKPEDWGDEIEFVLAVDGQRTLTQAHYIPLRYHLGMFEQGSHSPLWNSDQPYMMILNSPPHRDHPFFYTDRLHYFDYNKYFAIAVWQGTDAEPTKQLEIQRVSQDRNSISIEAHTAIPESISEQEDSVNSPYHIIWLNRLADWSEDVEIALSIDNELVLQRMIYANPHPFESIEQSIKFTVRDKEPAIHVITSPLEVSNLSDSWGRLRDEIRAVDYSKHFVIIVSQGYKQRRIEALEVEQLSLQGNHMIIDAFSMISPLLPGTIATNPYHLIQVSKEDIVGRELDFTLLINGHEVATQTHRIADVQQAYLPFVASER